MRTNPHEVWVAVADTSKARLLHCTVVPPGRCRVEEADQIGYSDLEHEHVRPSPRMGKAGGTGQNHEDEEHLRRVAKQTAAWLGAQLEQRHLDHVALFATPQLLGVLRAMPGPHTDERVEPQEAQLTNLNNRALSEHPLVRNLLRLPDTPWA